MKKKWISTTALLCLAGALAAQTPTPQTPVKSGNEWKMPGDVLQRSQHFADSLKKMLKLDDATTKSIFQAYLRNTKPVDEILITTSDEGERRQKLKANHLAFNDTLRQILKPAAYLRYRTEDSLHSH